MATGRTVYVSGQVGWNAATTRIESDDFVTQARLALENIVAVLRAGGAEPSHVVRLTWFITDKAAYLASRRQLGEAYRDVFGHHYPAMSVVVVSALVEDRAKVEIEATAVVPGSG
jgi:enamine deaminase RidA (YjgF/YER057c/UK114 family)